ncbi:hypothetical protein K431DRAFT_226718 [Polychaeton citri CBS 116435]|uniref:Uncharacterized protein n=1 Tax=Polychaeton citri CBS 116435 TaxID=1314669 RepID=A0A9P4Q6Q3_9PEZI|nr:hypothetical protein K431DRAFT_226718 [Polychaeton citri CBS 116435]
MSIYRQQMKKTAGGGPTDLPIGGRPELNRSSNSAPAVGFTGFHLGGLDGKPPGEAVKGKHDSDEDDDVPLGILQAHGFPGVNRPPTSGDAAGAGKASVAGSIANGGAGQGNLPPFARRLPPDPYFGASIVNHSNREALAFNGDAGSVYGVPPSMPPQMSAQLAPPQMGHPGGLVGVIAGEERARAARRGSPNAQGGYNTSPMPLPSNMPGQMGRTMSMGNIPPPTVYTPSGVPPVPMMPMMSPMMGGMPGQGAADQTQQQMQQFMQMQMQFMQNMLSMQQGQMGQQPQQDFLGVPGQPQSRPMSMASQIPPQQNHIPNSGRSMTMLNPPPSWGSMQPPVRPHSGMPQIGAYAPSVNGFNMNGGGGPGPGYTPSIAPSERSNIGMPSRYRPVSNFGDAQSGRAQSLTSSVTLQALKSELNQSTPNFLHPDSRQQPPYHQPTASRSTIRIVEKPKGSPRVSTTQLEKDEDEEDGWAAMKKKREERKFRLGRKTEKGDNNGPSLSDLYKNFD